ncbi:MAG: phenylpyruvate tautomerase MIF-related protein [Gammaproteobacteria bacterium]|nr:phenylpyruvate tautomerase MIF-related protein [Gammaproteobacteria bacterium]MDH5512761.1 phenylpyruvate tautomerase MIF-related protein [Gammaproteobacteria bacterium]
MPYLKIQTNREIAEDARLEFLKKASVLVSKNLGKPEKYVMVRLDPVQPMLFAGNDAPCAYLELKSIGLPESKTEALSKMLCQLILDEFKIPTERVYIEFADARDSMWGWDGGTF